MFDKLNTLVLSAMISLVLTAQALGQTARPPSAGSGTPSMSIERAWNWLMARPGVMIAIVICIAALAYGIYANRRKKA